MTTLREQILARATTALTGTTAAGSHVYRSRENSIPRDLTPSIVLMPESEADQRMGSYADRHEFVINVAIFTRGDPWDQLADGIAEVAHCLLVNDAQLLALATDVRKIGTDYEAQEADRTAGTLSARYSITYLSKSSDIAVLP